MKDKKYRVTKEVADAYLGVKELELSEDMLLPSAQKVKHIAFNCQGVLIHAYGDLGEEGSTITASELAIASSLALHLFSMLMVADYIPNRLHDALLELKEEGEEA